MRGVVVAMVAMAVLSACESGGAKAEPAYRELSGKGDYEASCVAARHAQSEYLSEGNAAKMAEMKNRADGECAAAQMTSGAR